MRKLLMLALCSGLVLSACSKKALVGKDVPKNPPSLPKTDPQVVGTPVAGFLLTSSFVTELQNKGLYTPDICLQMAEYKKGTQLIGTYLEISSVPCPGSGLVDDKDVLLRLTAVQDTQYPTNWRLIFEQSYSPEVGTIHKFVNNGVTEMRPEGPCDIDTRNENRGWDDYCSIAVESSLFRTPDPLDFYNLD